MTTHLHRRVLRQPGPHRARSGASIALAVIVAGAQAFAPLARAQDDATPPDIDHEPLREIAAGGEERIEASVADDASGVASVTLNLGLGDGGFEALAMEGDGGSRFVGTLSAEGLAEGDSLRYYLTATDGAGNEQSRGFAFDPLVVRVGPPATAVATGDEGGGRTLWYVVGGAIALGLVASLAGGGGGGDASDARTGPRLGQEIFVR